MTWQQLEARVREIARFRWDCEFAAEEINGVRVDGVGKVASDHWILIEVTKESDLTKLRTDLAKFQSVRPALFSQAIYAECFFVTEDEPPPSLITTGKGVGVTVSSAVAFVAAFLDYPRYFHARNDRPFGSAFDPLSGKKDTYHYVPVKYVAVDGGQEYTLTGLHNLIREGQRIILLGKFGTGKSRCIQELFSSLKDFPATYGLFPIAIDLRENWGIKRKQELLRRHLDDLGLSGLGDSAVKVLNQDRLVVLIDGFDEIGAQAWSDDVGALREIRKRSLDAVRDILASTTRGALIAGREHYFNSDDEMFECLGLSRDKTLVIECSDEFTESEMSLYLSHLSTHFETPAWLPRRPLVGQILSALEVEQMQLILDPKNGEAEFWSLLLDAVCDREARTKFVFDSKVIRGVFKRLARLTRDKPLNVGPISVAEINQAFEDVTSQRPADESAALLQRLALLGRVGPESAERQFVDVYFLDGLRAEDVSSMAFAHEVTETDKNWLNPLARFGLVLVADEIQRSKDLTGFFRVMRSASQGRNKILAGDVAGALLIAKTDDAVDFGGLILSGSTITELNLADVAASNLTIRDSDIGRLDLSFVHATDVRIERCEIDFVEGVAEAVGLPNWIVDCTIKQYRQVNTTARIRAADLNEKQRVLLAIVKKTFFQPGGGRKEEALLRGLGNLLNRGEVNKILKRLIRDSVLSEVKGDHGTIYVPNRAMTNRMRKLLDDLTLSKDPIWLFVS